MQKAEKDLLVKKSDTFSIANYMHHNRVDMGENHYHRHYEMLLIYENDRILLANDQEFALNKNCIALIPPFVLHRTICGEKSPQRVFLINFTGDFIKGVIDSLGIDLLRIFETENFILNFPPDKIDYIYSLIRDILTEYQKGGTLGKANAYLSLCRILTEFYALKPASYEQFQYNKTVSEIVNFFENSYGEEISLDLLSNKFSVSKYEISRLFRKYTGTTMIKYLNNIRIAKAKELLKSQKVPITQIAMQTGFGSLSSFGRVFKQITGVSPQKYKEYLKYHKEDKEY